MNGFWRAAKPDYAIDVPEERYALWLDMHSLEYTREYGKRAGFGDAQIEWLKRPHPFQIMSLAAYGPEYPSVQAYPLEQLVEYFGRDYFTSGVAYAIALAAAQHDVAEIGLFGIDLIHDTEYADQRPCAEYWLGRAEGLGIHVTTHPDSAVLRQRYRYGYESENELVGVLRGRLHAHAEKVDGAIKARLAEIEKAHAQNHTDNGALQMIVSILDGLDGYTRGGKL